MGPTFRQGYNGVKFKEGVIPDPKGCTASHGYELKGQGLHMAVRRRLQFKRASS